MSYAEDMERLMACAVTFEVPGRPKGKARPRFAGGCVYTPRATRDYERLIGAYAKSAIRREGLRESSPCAGSVTVCAIAYFPVPKSWPKKRREAARRGEERPTCKPDIDNIEKALLDGVNKIAYTDDCQVVDAHVAKWYEPALTPKHPAGRLLVGIDIAGGTHD